MRHPVLIASILTLLSACDKPTPEPETPPIPLTSITDTTVILFQVYGDREELRAAPLALVEKGQLTKPVLDEKGWRYLDSVFFAMGREMPIYRFGSSVGTVGVVRGMWPIDSAPLYDLPGCKNLVPQARLRFRSTGAATQNLEFLASSVPLRQPPEGRAVPVDGEALARKLADSTAGVQSVGTEELHRLQFVSRWMATGAGTAGRTLMGNYIDPEAGDAGPGAGATASVLILAEDSARTMIVTYRHVASGASRSVEFQRLVNHADLDGDGIDEMILEAWHYAQVPELVVLKRLRVRWTEAFRVSENWCLDPPAPGTPGATDAAPAGKTP
jgi:hypothetical protein